MCFKCQPTKFVVVPIVKIIEVDICRMFCNFFLFTSLCYYYYYISSADPQRNVNNNNKKKKIWGMLWKYFVNMADDEYVNYHSEV